MDIKEQIKKLAKEKNAVILAHYYVDGAIQDIADFVGDSLALAQKAAQSAVMLAEGQGVEDENLSQYDDGTEKVPYLKIDPVSVTESNINEVIIKSGFHLKEDVYLNVPGKMPSN